MEVFVTLTPERRRLIAFAAWSAGALAAPAGMGLM
jgi:hypothetical protein